MDFKSNYYDKPDGQDVGGKMLATNKYALIAGLGYATTDCLFLSKPVGYGPTIARYIYFTGPLMGMASAFTMVTYTSARMRGKDDKLNYVIGAFAAGGVYGAWKKSVLGGLLAGAAFAAAGILKKESVQAGWEFFPQPKRHISGSLWGARHDWSMMENRPKNWSKD